MKNLSATICCLLAFLAIASAKVESCYFCNSVENPACADPFVPNENLIQKCPTTPDHVCMKVGTETNGVEVDIRSCVPASGAQAQCDQLETAAEAVGASVTCSICDTDNCNTGTLHRVSALLLGIILFVYYISK